MPSYRYTKDIKPEDLQPDKPPEPSKKQKRANWWHYHWGWVAGGLAVVAVAAFFIYDMVNVPVPDAKIGILAPYSLPDSALETLTGALEAAWGDIDGNGEALVEAEVYTINFTGEGEVDEDGNYVAPEDESASEDALGGYEDPYAQMAGVVRLTGAFESAEVIIFLADPEQVESYQETYGLFGPWDGGSFEGADVYDVTVAFSELAALDGYDLTLTDAMGNSLDLRDLLADYRVGLRAYGGTRLESMDGGRAAYEQGRQLLEALM